MVSWVLEPGTCSTPSRESCTPVQYLEGYCCAQSTKENEISYSTYIIEMSTFIFSGIATVHYRIHFLILSVPNVRIIPCCKCYSMPKSMPIFSPCFVPPLLSCIFPILHIQLVPAHTRMYCTFHILYLVKGCGNSTFSYFREQVCKNFKNIRSFVLAKIINLQIGQKN